MNNTLNSEFEDINESGIINNVRLIKNRLHENAVNFSNSDNMEVLLREYIKTIDYLISYWTLDVEYKLVLEILSIGVLYGCPKPYFVDLYNVMQRKGASDAVFNYLIHYVIGDKVQGRGRYYPGSDDYRVLRNIIYADEKQSEKIMLKYIAQWENVHRKQYSLTNLWCWEVAALVKVKKINEEPFFKFECYPQLKNR